MGVGVGGGVTPASVIVIVSVCVLPLMVMVKVKTFAPAARGTLSISRVLAVKPFGPTQLYVAVVGSEPVCG